MTDNSNKTVTASTISESGSNAIITIPETAYYDSNSKISVPIEIIKKNVTSISNSISVGFKASASPGQTNDTSSIFNISGMSTLGISCSFYNDAETGGNNFGDPWYQAYYTVYGDGTQLTRWNKNQTVDISGYNTIVVVLHVYAHQFKNSNYINVSLTFS